MTTNEKARKMFDAAMTVAADYRSERNEFHASKVEKAFAGLPTKSAARLYDIFVAVGERADARREIV